MSDDLPEWAARLFSDDEPLRQQMQAISRAMGLIIKPVDLGLRIQPVWLSGLSLTPGTGAILDLDSDAVRNAVSRLFSGPVAGAVAADDMNATIEENSGCPARLVDGLALALVFLWLVALAMSVAQEMLPPEARDILNGLYATIGLALTVTWRTRDNRNH